MEDRGFFMTWQAVSRQLTAMPSELYLVRLIHAQSGRAFPGERLWSAAQLVSAATIRFLRARNREGCDIYIYPYAGDQNAGYILVDLDVPQPMVLETMRPHGHAPCVVLQTSPGHLQAWVLSRYRSAATCGGDRCGQVVGACLWRRPGEHGLAPSGKTRRFHQSEARAPRFERTSSLGQTAVRPCGPGATSRLPAAARPKLPCNRGRWRPIPTPLFPATRLLFPTSPPRRPAPSTAVVCSAGGSPTAFRNPIGASSICGLPATCCRRERRRPASRPFSGSPARISPAVTIAQTTTCTAPSRGLLFPPQGGVLCDDQRPAPAFAAGHRAVSNPIDREHPKAECQRCPPSDPNLTHWDGPPRV